MLYRRDNPVPPSSRSSSVKHNNHVKSYKNTRRPNNTNILSENVDDLGGICIRYAKHITCGIARGLLLYWRSVEITVYLPDSLTESYLTLLFCAYRFHVGLQTTRSTDKVTAWSQPMQPIWANTPQRFDWQLTVQCGPMACRVYK